MVSDRRLTSVEGVAVELALQEEILDSVTLQTKQPLERGLSLEDMIDQGLLRNGDLAKLLVVSKSLVERLEAAQNAFEENAIPAPHLRNAASPESESLDSKKDRIQRLDQVGGAVLPVMDDDDDQEEYEIVTGLEPADDWQPGWEQLADVTVVPFVKLARKLRIPLLLGAIGLGLAGLVYVIANTQLPG